ncbi:Predicted transcriptional regulator [Prochlorococcus marinus str. MIT 9211]|uniref:Predicted transcriptional regulator n=2 Tax=Prochlorococcus marinus TaxID=1219 RepID=A9BBH2_PROM4|nr:Predicted transcriptional regulator [Prochlorococcus marinus str. MIT 9211]
MSRGTIYNKIHAGTFPKQIPIGANLVVWLERDVQQWMQEQVDKSRG